MDITLQPSASMAKHSHGPLLERAAQIVGGDANLRKFLNASPERYSLWREGATPLPWDMFLKTVDLLSDHYDEQIRRTRAQLADLQQPSARDLCQPPSGRNPPGMTVVLRETMTVERRPPGKEPSVQHPFFDSMYVPHTLSDLMETALDAALTVARTDLGDVQIIDDEGRPHVEAQRGFSPQVADALCMLEMPLGQHRPVFLPDLASDPAYMATKEGALILGAGARALAAAPIVHRSGMVLGVIAAHYRQPHKKDAGTLALLQLVGRRTAGWLDLKSFA